MHDSVSTFTVKTKQFTPSGHTVYNQVTIPLTTGYYSITWPNSRACCLTAQSCFLVQIVYTAVTLTVICEVERVNQCAYDSIQDIFIVRCYVISVKSGQTTKLLVFFSTKKFRSSFNEV